MRFDSYHPALNLIYFATAILCTVWFHHPVFLLISYGCAFAYSVLLLGKKALVFDMILVPCIIVFGLWYSSYHHFGVTNLKRNFIGNQITLESLAVGFVIGVTAAAVLMWIVCLSRIFTADKAVYLLGRISPRISLYISLFLRMIPRTAVQERRVDTAQKGIGRGSCDGPLLRRFCNVFRILSILVSWLLETMIESSVSMKSRGYGLKGRTAYSIYRFDNRDRSLVFVFFACISVIAAGIVLDQTQISYNPQIIWNRITALSFFFYISYAVFLLIPLILQCYGEWHFAKLNALDKR